MNMIGLVIPSRIGEYLIAAIAIILAPGPSVLFVIARAISWGRRVAVLTVLGNASGALTLSAVVALGFGPLLSRSDLLYAAVQWGGGLYLLYLGIDAWRKRAMHAAGMTAATDTSEPTLWQCVRDGFWVGALNPKGIVFFAAVLPPFVDKEQGNISQQLLLMGAIFAVLAFFLDSSWGLLAGTARAWLADDTRRLIALRATGGIVIMALGILVIATAARDLITA
jgi:threonine/homoserine/homoserine lactone efflux protein